MASTLDFLFQGSPPKSVTTYGSSTVGLPQWYNDYIQGLANRANTVAGAPYQAYTGPRVAPLTPDQQAAFQTTRDAAGNWQPMLNQAAGTLGTGGALAYGAGTTTTPQVINQYMNPYMDAVTNRIAQLGTRNLQENILPGINATFTGAGQFGGSRNQEFTSRAIRDTANEIAGQQAGALASGYAQAQGAAGADLSRMLGAGGALAGMAGQYGALAGQQQSQSLRDAAALEAIGQEQQQQQQQNLDVAYNQFLEERGWPQAETSWMSGILRGQQLPTTTTQTQTGPASYYNPSLAQMLIGGGATLAGLGGTSGLSNLLGFQQGGAVSASDVAPGAIASPNRMPKVAAKNKLAKAVYSGPADPTRAIMKPAHARTEKDRMAIRKVALGAGGNYGAGALTFRQAA